MKYFKINSRICAVVLAVIVACTGCKKGYLDVNDDPNRATDANVTAELIFPNAAHNVGVRLASANLRFVQNWVGYFAQAGDYAILQDETSYIINFSFGDALWENEYNVLFDLYLTKQKALAVGDSVLAGASMVLSARLWQDMVDIYGNIPYSKAFQGVLVAQPAYDKAQDIYAALQTSLDSANIYLQGTAKSTFAATDIVNNGNITLWTKFANTLKLRLLIRQSQVNGFNPAAEIAKIQANGGVLHAGENIDVNPGYVNDVNKQSPFYANFGFTTTGSQASPSTRANTYFVNLLNSTNDPRLSRYFRAPSAGGPITGCVYGLSAGNPIGKKSSYTGPGLVGSATQNQWIFPAFESMFLEAEAIARGWMTGVAQDAYESAVKESFTWLGVPNATTAATTYMSGNPIANWATVAGSNVLAQAKFIAAQKYVAMCGTDPVEAWSDIRRLDMLTDKGYISVNASRPILPVRILLPQIEYTSNGDNARAQGTISQFDSKLFWQP
ncbi:hypothetical protein A4D02_20620 [Niastella koreensis]|uniref:SusD/RagB family nutrient-binding outer membrane lipoprotein n=2 Tax=Niastella koreensis TaxID=354356 RepID=G8TLK3_NIAKG|nr:SusD/RagB family nutrient-binding outer membrane lipoprotein [Niastella koreensis]AEV96572.1 hypothetical protein Niako_0172 [Niastella koreensis GR20-10]OQP54087.1 hypothetical protein A4D02_20620 [Niastella koreensis]